MINIVTWGCGGDGCILLWDDNLWILWVCDLSHVHLSHVTIYCT